MRILECLTGAQGSAAKSRAIQHSTVPHQYCCATYGKMALECVTHEPWKVGEEREPATREVNLQNRFLLYVCAEHLCSIPSPYVADLGIFFFLMASQMHINIENYNKF